MTERRGGGVRLDWTELTQEELSLQAEVRAFLAAELGRDAGRCPAGARHVARGVAACRSAQ